MTLLPVQCYLKTGTLFANSCRSVSLLSCRPSQLLADQAETYGRQLGIAFQIVDDMLDYVASEEQLVNITLTLSLTLTNIIFILIAHCCCPRPDPQHPQGKPGLGADLGAGLLTAPLLLAARKDPVLATLLQGGQVHSQAQLSFIIIFFD